MNIQEIINSFNWLVEDCKHRFDETEITPENYSKELKAAIEIKNNLLLNQDKFVLVDQEFIQAVATIVENKEMLDELTKIKNFMESNKFVDMLNSGSKSLNKPTSYE